MSDCSFLKVIFLFALAAFIATGQRPPRIVSPEVHPDRTVTFRLRGPEVNEVVLEANWAGDPKPLDKGDDGVWTITIGPVEPGIFSYRYRIDGVSTIDPHNPGVKPWAGGASSLVEIPAGEPAFYDLRDVPHGDLHVHRYHSSTVGKTRRVFVYTPPGYDAGDADYPTLYLLHGAGDNESLWSQLGRADLILDNLIAIGQAKPMLVVMPNGHPVPYGEHRREPGRNTDQFRDDLVKDLLPFIESRYRVRTDRLGRAVVGLSMGGGQALHVGLGRTDLFSQVGAFSAAVSDPPSNPAIQAFIADPEKSNQEVRLLWIAIGEDDFLLERNRKFTTYLKEKGIDFFYAETVGDHSWPVWRRYLHEFAGLLFRFGDE